ncbi:GFA family protein [Novosphingobium sp. HK4-1]|uniref:GFA family protein n=2 Tax=Novosphingobium mangrovi (ex Huang et al. 2023) TaxID=2976432 RepID=A0ABT2I6D6_9SPHN|nr:GFA family protein [Novosphingobium mangrovi (ex Huang et al. 2023)]
MSKTMTGGCQCGRIRYSVEVEGEQAGLCHCRKCKKATGGFAAAIAMVQRSAVQWSREPDWYASSPVGRRAFCSSCGSPLGFAYVDPDEPEMDLYIGSFDEPGFFRPVAHGGAESLHEAWLDTKDLPRKRTAESAGVAKQWKAAGLEVPE